MKNKKTLEINEVPNSYSTSLHYFITNLYKTLLKNRKTFEINEIPNPNYDEGYLRYLQSSPNSDAYGEARSGEMYGFLRN